MNIYRMIWWITAVILAASGGIAAAVTVQTDVLVSAVIAAVLIGGGSPWLRPITRRTTPPPPRNLLPIALRDGATWAAGVVTVIGLITLAGAPALPLILLMAITSAPVCRYLRDRVEFTQSPPRSPRSPPLIHHAPPSKCRFIRCPTAVNCRTKPCADVGE